MLASHFNDIRLFVQHLIHANNKEIIKALYCRKEPRYLNASQYDNTLFLFTLFSCLKYCFIFTYYFSTVIYINVVRTLSIAEAMVVLREVDI